MEHICEHLGVDFQPEQLSPERRHPRYRSDTAQARLFQPITASAVGVYREKLDPAVVVSIERQAAEAMSAFGYDFASPFGQAYQAIQL